MSWFRALMDAGKMKMSQHIFLDPDKSILKGTIALFECLYNFVYKGCRFILNLSLNLKEQLWM